MTIKTVFHRRSARFLRGAIACAFFLSCAFFSAHFLFPVCQKNEVSFSRAAVTVYAEEENSKQTDRFDDPFGEFSGMSPEDIGANFSSEKNTTENSSKALVVVLIIAAICAAFAICSSLRAKKLRRRAAAVEKRKLEAIGRFVSTNPILYADIDDMVRHGNVRLIYAGEDGVLLQDESRIYENGTYVFAAESDAAARKILLSCPEERQKMSEGLFSCHGEKNADLLREFFSFDKSTVCYQTVYAPKEPLALRGALRFSLAGEKQLPLIISTYDKESPAALEKLVRLGQIYCAYALLPSQSDPSFQEETFVGYIGRHPEGSMGLLFIFPEYRRRGFAEELERFQINSILAAGRTPYAHIIVDNDKSLALQKKLGAIFADDKVVWLSSSRRRKN